MTSDQTENQSHDELDKAKRLSLEPARPPAAVAGYQLQQFVGSGAYGEVWSATNLKTGRRVAIKFYTRRNRNDVRSLAREVEKLVVLSADRYVVQLLDVGWDAEPPHYVMEYIEHGSLEDRLKTARALPVAESVELFKELATGMMHLHSKGILHCDLKPGNVLLDQDGRPRVADFGQARLSTDQTPALGTLFYMAPEQADINAMPDASWDVYGLGALLFCMITGKPPYYTPELAKDIETTDRINDRLAKYRETLMSAELPTDHRSVPGVDRALADIIDRCITPNPKKRFGSIQSVLLALRQREIVRARRPLMLLGIIGPLILMAVVSLFGLYAFNEAISQTRNAVSDKARESNEFAAELAARSAAEQIDEYFRVVLQLSRDKEFLDQFDEMTSDEALTKIRMRLADPTRNAVDASDGPDPLAEIRQAFKDNDKRQKLQPALERRLKDLEREFPEAASWFVCDRYGNQVASVFLGPNNTLANNYAFRSYFTGLPSDLPETAPSLNVGQDVTQPALIDFQQLDQQLRQRTIIDGPHLSAVFKSEQSDHWKVAFSTPIRRYGEIEGLVAVTVDLGGLVEFAGRPNQYAMLVDGRQGENEGAILEHPIYKQRLAVGDLESIPEELATVYVDNLDAAADEETFYDPVGKTEIGQQLGYDHPSLVSIVDVTMDSIFQTGSPQTAQVNANQRTPTRLYVLAVQDYRIVSSDVDNLRSQLLWLGGFALATLLLVGASIAYIVNQLLRESRERLSRTFAPSEDTSALHEMETIADVGHSRNLTRQ